MYLKYKKKDSAAGYFALDYGYGKTDTDVFYIIQLALNNLLCPGKTVCAHGFLTE